MGDVTWLKRLEFFSGLSDEALGELARIAIPRRAKRGEALFAEGEAALALFILREGVVDLLKGSSSGREQLVRRVKRREIFAEAAVFAGGSYPVTAVARAPSELLAIRRERFLDFLRRYPDASLAIMGVMANLLRHLNMLLADLSLEEVVGRLAAFLLARSRERGRPDFSIGMTKRDLAARLGAVPETLSRNLRKLREGGAIVVRGDFVKILDAARLERAAGR